MEHCVHTCVGRLGWGCIPRQGPPYGRGHQGAPRPSLGGQPQRLLGRPVCSGRAGGACSPLLCFLPSRALRPLPRHLRQSAKAAAARPRAPTPSASPPLLSSIVSHGSPGQGGGGGGGGGSSWPCSDPSPPARDLPDGTQRAHPGPGCRPGRLRCGDLPAAGRPEQAL